MYEYLIPELINCMSNTDEIGIGMHCLVCWACFTKVSRVLHIVIAIIYNERNYIYSENFKMKFCTWTKSMTKFHLDILRRKSVTAVHKFKRIFWRTRKTKTSVKQPLAFITTQCLMSNSFFNNVYFSTTSYRQNIIRVQATSNMLIVYMFDVYPANPLLFRCLSEKLR